MDSLSYCHVYDHETSVNTRQTWTWKSFSSMKRLFKVIKNLLQEFLKGKSSHPSLLWRDCFWFYGSGCNQVCLWLVKINKRKRKWTKCVSSPLLWQENSFMWFIVVCVSCSSFNMCNTFICALGFARSTGWCGTWRNHGEKSKHDFELFFLFFCSLMHANLRLTTELDVSQHALLFSVFIWRNHIMCLFF